MMINVDLFDNDELIEIRQETLDKLVEILPKKYHDDLATLLECEYELTLREGK